MRTIKQSDLDELVRLTRKYKRTGDTDILAARAEATRRLSEDTFRDDYHWLAFSDLVSGVLGGHGLCEGATMDTLISVFNALGYAVK